MIHSSLCLLLVLLASNSATTTHAFVQHGPRGATRIAADTSLYATPKKAATKKKKSKKAPTPQLKKAELIAAVSEHSGLSRSDTEQCIASFLDVMKTEIAAGKRIGLSNFGTFTLRERAARKGRNPSTGEPLDIAASVAPGFSVSKVWKEELNG